MLGAGALLDRNGFCGVGSFTYSQIARYIVHLLPEILPLRLYLLALIRHEPSVIKAHPPSHGKIYRTAFSSNAYDLPRGAYAVESAQ